MLWLNTYIEVFSTLENKKKKQFISLMPANLYGEGDNFDLKI